MKRTDKLNMLQQALRGNTAMIRQLQRQQQKKAMPFLEVHGIVDIRHCSPLLKDIRVIPSESLSDGDRTDHLSLEACLERFEKTQWQQPNYTYDAIGSIEADESRYDEVVLAYVRIRHLNYATTYLPHQSIAQLRAYFGRSADCLEQSFILLSFDSDSSRHGPTSTNLTVQ